MDSFTRYTKNADVSNSIFNFWPLQDSPKHGRHNTLQKEKLQILNPATTLNLNFLVIINQLQVFIQDKDYEFCHYTAPLSLFIKENLQKHIFLYSRGNNIETP